MNVRMKSGKRLLSLLSIAGIIIAAMSASPAFAGQIDLYSVTLRGVVQGRSFARQGTVGIATRVPTPTQNGANPLELVIVSGNPAISPQIGAIQFGTNTFFLGGRASLDMAFVSFANNCIIARPDQRMSATGLNGFNSRSGLTADFYQIFAGDLSVCSTNGFRTISGSVNILGTGAIFHSNTPYQATLTGTFIGSNRF
jgi:hypothetical protein